MHNDVDKRRIGLILPSVNIRMEPELNRCRQLMAFNFYATRVMLDNTTEETLKGMERDLLRASEMIATVLPEAVVYGCTSGSFIQGENGNSSIIETIKSKCGCPVVTASQAMIDSMKMISAKKITLVTPYTDDIKEKEKQFFENNGIEVAAMKGLQIVPAEILRTQSVETIENLVVKHIDSTGEVRFDSNEVNILIDGDGKSICELCPVLVVDAIMAKRNTGTNKEMAPIVIAVGPGFCAPKDVHAVVETKRGHYLGRVLYDGSALPNTGVPGIINGYGIERLLRSPGSGHVEPLRQIGDCVIAGEAVASVNGLPVISQMDGVVRGLIHRSVTAFEGMKIGDVDPRQDAKYCCTFSDKVLAIGGGVLEAAAWLSGK